MNICIILDFKNKDYMGQCLCSEVEMWFGNEAFQTYLSFN